MFSDSTDRLFLLTHKDGFYEIDRLTGERKAISTAPHAAGLNDAAMCPATTVEFDKPILTIGDASVVEGDSGEKDMVFHLTWNKAATFSINYHTLENDNSKINAMSNVDYTNMGGASEGNIESDIKGIDISIPIKGDKKVQFYWKDQHGEAKTACSTDAFSVRPDTFVFVLPTNAKAGEAFKIDLTAVDKDGKSVVGYNESIKTSFDINFTDKDPNCVEGTLDISGINFTDGIISQDINYSEVGELDFSIFEIEGSEFALVDENDTVDDERFIATITSTMSFTAGYLTIEEWGLKNGVKDFTYFANEIHDVNGLNVMHAELNATIKAYNMAGELLVNYDSLHYAKATDLLVKYSKLGNIINTLNWADNIEGQTHRGVGAGNSFVFDIATTQFDAGVANTIININFARDKTTAKNPMRLTIIDLNVTDSDGISGSSSTSSDKSADFYYGRLHTPNYYGTGKNHQIRVYHEIYCKNCNTPIDIFKYAHAKASEDNINWYVLDIAQYSDGGGFSDFKGVNHDDFIDKNSGQIISATSNVMESDGEDEIKLTIPKAPFRDRMTYKPSPWLVYNRFNTSADKHSFNINLSSSSGWAGKGEEGMTAKGSASRRSNQKMDW